MAPLQPLILQPHTWALPNPVSTKGVRKYERTKDPLSILFTERFLILDVPKTKSGKTLWAHVKVNDILRVTIALKEGGNRGRTTQSSCGVENESTGEAYVGYPVNVLRYLKRLKYQQL